MNARIQAALAMVALVALAACAGGHKPQRREVVIQQLSYSPDTLTVQQGDTVVWINRDVVPHTATDTIGAHWDTGTILNGAQAAVVMTTKGTADYFCSFHPTMKGQITVR